jgi:hypothetical protein
MQTALAFAYLITVSFLLVLISVNKLAEEYVKAIKSIKHCSLFIWIKAEVLPILLLPLIWLCKRVPFPRLPFQTIARKKKKGKGNFTGLWAIFCGRHHNDIMYLSLYLFFFFMFPVIKQFTYEITLGRVFCPNNLPFSLLLFILVSFFRLYFNLFAPTGKKLNNC